MRRMLSEEQLKKKILKYAPGGGSGSGYTTVISENSGNTPLNVEWDKQTAGETEHVIGILYASESTYGVIYCVRKANPTTYDRYDKYITTKIWSEGAGEYIYGWERI